MPYARSLWFAFLLALAATPLAAQSRFRKGWDDLRHIPMDVGSVWLAPFRIDRDDLRPIAITGAAWGLALWKDAEMQAWVDDHNKTAFIEASKPFRSIYAAGHLGDIWMLIRYSGVAWVVGVAFDSEIVRDAATGCVSAGIAQTVLRRNAVYNLVKRTRPLYTDDPYTFRTPGSKDWNTRSFWGGHTANAMTCIAYWNHRFDLKWAEPVLYGMAAGVAIARTAQQAHWVSDNVFGLAMGYMAGRIVAGRTLERRQKEDSAAAGKPQFNATVDGNGVTVWWTIMR